MTQPDFEPEALPPVNTSSDNGSTWDLETWMRSLSPDPEVVELLWQVVGAAIRPTMNPRMGVWLYSKSGDNGKRALCELIRNLVGPTWVSLPLSKIGSKSAMRRLQDASLIITDDNEPSAVIRKPDDLKAIIDGDLIVTKTQFHRPVTFRFTGFMIQCFDTIPPQPDPSSSLNRRLLQIPLENHEAGDPRVLEHVRHPEVLRYAVGRVLTGMPAYYSLSRPASLDSTRSTR